MKPARTRLAPERKSITRRFKIPRGDGGELRMYVNVGLFADGRPGEMFIRADKAGSFEAGILDALAMSVSVALQHGVPIDLFVEKFRGMRFEPSGFTGDKDFPTVSSALDLIARWLKARFGGVDAQQAE